ncbi:MAG TPA: hypothetical protein VLA43_10115, partial [Longimicrobiales bacterium]|nr:hypothetical protein [Longimicrobiales bacterium]
MASEDDALRRRFGQLTREWLFGNHPPDPVPAALPSAVPRVAGAGGLPAVPEGEAHITWVGHATTLVQFPGLNILTDPVWSDRCSPVGFMGP